MRSASDEEAVDNSRADLKDDNEYSNGRGESKGSKSRKASDGEVDDILDDIGSEKNNLSNEEFLNVSVPAEAEEIYPYCPDAPDGSAAAKPKPKPKKIKELKKQNCCIGKSTRNLQ